MLCFTDQYSGIIVYGQKIFVMRFENQKSAYFAHFKNEELIIIKLKLRIRLIYLSFTKRATALAMSTFANRLNV